MLESNSILISVMILAAVIFAGVAGFCYFISKVMELIDVEDERS